MQSGASWGQGSAVEGSYRRPHPYPGCLCCPHLRKMRPRDNTRVNKLFSKAGRLLHPPSAPFPPASSRRERSMGGWHRPAPGARPPATLTNLTTALLGLGALAGQWERRAAVAWQRAPEEGGAGERWIRGCVGGQSGTLAALRPAAGGQPHKPRPSIAAARSA